MSRLAALWEEFEDEETLVVGESLSPNAGGGGLSTAFPDQDMAVRILAYPGADPTAASSTWPAAVDLSSRLLDQPMRIVMGRGPNQRTLQSGSCSFVLDNDDGALTPLLATSTYYPGWDLGVPVSIDIGNLPPNPAAWYPRFRGYAADIRPDIIPKSDGTSTSVVRVTLGGILRRVSQGAVARSALSRTLRYGGGNAAQAYWPMEDGGSSTVFGSGLTGGSPMTVTTATFANVASLAGSDALPTFAATSALSGPIGGSFTSGWTVSVYALFPAGPSTRVTLMEVYSTGGTATRWVLEADSSTVYVTGYDAGGTSVHSSSASGTIYTTLFGNAWVWVAFYVNDTDSFGVSVYPISSNVGYGASVSGAVAKGGTPNRIAVFASTAMANAAMGHMAVFSGGSLSFIPVGSTAGVSSAPLAYAGELAHLRVIRTCREEGIPYVSLGAGTYTGVEMGPQAIADPVEVMRDCEAVDHGFLAEAVSDWALGYLIGGNRANLDPTLTIDLSTYRTSQDTEARVLLPTRNDQRIRNEETISRDGGASSTYVDSAHQAKRGRYNDATTLNVYTDAATLQQASWAVHEGNADLLRYGTIPLDLAANPALVASWVALVPTYRVDRTNHPSPPHPKDNVSFSFEGYAETLTHVGWSADIVVEPYSIWVLLQMAQASGDTNPSLGRAAEDDLCAIRTAIDSTTTSIVIDPNFMRWTTTADDLTPPIPVRYGGETGTVSAVATTAGSYVAIGAASHADNAYVTATLFAGHTANDLIVLVARYFSAAGTLSTPPGYTLLARNPYTYVWGKVDTGFEINPDVAPSGGSAGDVLSAYTIGLRNTSITLSDLSRIIWTSSKKVNASAQNIAFPDINPTPYDGCFLLLIAGKNDDWTSVAQPTGWTEILDTSTTTGNDQGLYAAYILQTTHANVLGDSLVVTGGGSAVSEAMVLVIPAGYQTLTVARSVNGVAKAQTAGTRFAVDAPLILSL